MEPPFDLQGHRGARGLRPENTLPSFEAALDCLVTSIETDLILTRDGALVLHHDFQIHSSTRRHDGTPVPLPTPFLHALTLTEVRQLVADGNPDREHFPSQSPEVPDLSGWASGERGMHPYAIPTLADLVAFASAYGGEPGARFGKSTEQRAAASRLVLDLEVKAAPFFESSADRSLRETRVLANIGGWPGRCRVRSFDHRVVRSLVERAPRLEGAVLVAGTAPARPAALAAEAGASVYCPDYRFLDADAVQELHDAGCRVIPWTANTPAEWERLLDWGVDGITTDYPDRLGAFIRGGSA